MWTAQDGDYEAVFPACDFKMPGDPFDDEPFIDESPSIGPFIDFCDDIDPYGEDYNETLPEVTWSLIHNY